MNKLPVLRATGEVYAGVTRHFLQLLIVAWPAVLIIFAGTVLVNWYLVSIGFDEAVRDYMSDPDPEKLKHAKDLLAQPTALMLDWGANIAAFLAGAVAAVRWHRFVLFGENNPVGKSGGHLVRREDGSYLWVLLKLLAVAAVAFIVWGVFFSSAVAIFSKGPGAEWAGGLIKFAAILVVIWGGVLMLRAALALPAAALGADSRLAAAMENSTGNSWRLLAMSLLLLFPLFIVGGLVMLQSGLAESHGLSKWLLMKDFTLKEALLAAFSTVFSFYSLMLQITMLSVAYREIIGLPGEEEPPEVTV